MKKALRETRTLRAGCSKAEPEISPRRRPFPGAQDGQNLTSWRWSLPLPTNWVWWRSMHGTHTRTDRTDYNTLRRS